MASEGGRPSRGDLTPETMVERPSRNHRRPAILLVVVVSMPLAALLLFMAKQSFDRSVSRALGEGLADTASRAKEAISRWDGEDWQKVYRAAGAVFDLTTLGKEVERLPLPCSAFDQVVTATKRTLRQEDVLTAALTHWMRQDLLERVEAPSTSARPLADLATLEILEFARRQSLGEKGRAELGRAEHAVARAVAAAPIHWRPRFLQAALKYLESYGKPHHDEAIRAFEELLDRQASEPRRDEHVWTYLFLGNLYLEARSRIEAREIWQRGLEVFPEDDRLSGRLQQYPSHSSTSRGL